MSYRWLLRLYPDDWRTRYGDEFEALLEDCPRSPRTLLDVVSGAVDARLHAAAVLGRMLTMGSRLRTAEITIFCAFILFVVSGIGFQKMSEDFVHVERVYPAIGTPFTLIVAGAVVALLAVLAGGLPIALAALGYGLRQRRWDIPLLFLVPPVMLAIVIGYVWLLLNVVVPNRAGSQGGIDYPVALSLIGLFILAAILSTGAVALAIGRSEVGEGVYRFALAPAVVAVVAMAVVLGAVVAWGLGVQADAPQLYSGNHGFLATATAASWIGHIVTMGLAVVIGLAGLVRGLGAGRTPGRVAQRA